MAEHERTPRRKKRQGRASRARHNEANWLRRQAANEATSPTQALVEENDSQRNFPVIRWFDRTANKEATRALSSGARAPRFGVDK